MGLTNNKHNKTFRRWESTGRVTTIAIVWFQSIDGCELTCFEIIPVCRWAFDRQNNNTWPAIDCRVGQSLKKKGSSHCLPLFNCEFHDWQVTSRRNLHTKYLIIINDPLNNGARNKKTWATFLATIDGQGIKFAWVELTAVYRDPRAQRVAVEGRFPLVHHIHHLHSYLTIISFYPFHSTRFIRETGHK